MSKQTQRSPWAGFGIRARYLLALLVWLSFGGVAQAAPSSTSGLAEAVVLRPLRVTPIKELNFGSLLVVNVNVLGSSRLTLSPSGRASATGGLLTVWLTAGRHPGEARVTGEAQVAYSVSAPESISLPWGKNTLTVQDFRFTSSTRGGVGPSGYAGQLNSAGNDRIFIGGTLVFPPRIVGAIAVLLRRSLSIPVPVTVQYQ